MLQAHILVATGKDAGAATLATAMAMAMTKKNSRIQTFVSHLSVIGVCAPMIGLPGTVTRMIGAFAVVGSSGKRGGIPLFRLRSVKLPPFPNCDLQGPVWRVESLGGGSPLDALKPR